MQATRQSPPWQRLLALLSVLAVAVGLAPHDVGGNRQTASLSPTPLPELRAVLPLPSVQPQESGEAPALQAGPPRRTAPPARQRARARAEHAPEPRAQSGVKLLGGG